MSGCMSSPPVKSSKGATTRPASTIDPSAVTEGERTMRRMIGRRSRRLVLVTLTLLALAAGIAYATIPDGGKVYTACMLNGVGTIRLIDPSLPDQGPPPLSNSLLRQFAAQMAIGGIDAGLQQRT